MTYIYPWVTVSPPRQPVVQQPQYSGISLTVQGQKVHLSQRTEKLLLDETMNYYQGKKLRVTPPTDNLQVGPRLPSSCTDSQALFAEAELLSGGSNTNGTPKMVELIDTIMSIPSCLQVLSPPLLSSPPLQDQQSKVQVVNKWIQEHKDRSSPKKEEEEVSCISLEKLPGPQGTMAFSPASSSPAPLSSSASSSPQRRVGVQEEQRKVSIKPDLKLLSLTREEGARKEAEAGVTADEARVVKTDSTSRFRKKIKFTFKNKSSLRKLKESNGSVKALESFHHVEREEGARPKLLSKGERDSRHKYCCRSIKTCSASHSPGAAHISLDNTLTQPDNKIIVNKNLKFKKIK